MRPKALVKNLLGELPLTAEIDWLLRYRSNNGRDS
jgi:hypothetical protein